MEPDQVIYEGALAEALEISRTPVREALNILINEGWVVRANSRLRIAPLSKTEVQNLFFIREYLEALSVYQAMINSDDSFINKLQEINEAFKGSTTEKDSKKTVDIGKRFHDAILKQANNPILEKNLLTIIEGIERYRHFGIINVPERAEMALQEHQKVLNAIINHESEKAEQAMRDHISSSYKYIMLSKELQNI